MLLQVLEDDLGVVGLLVPLVTDQLADRDVLVPQLFWHSAHESAS